MTKQIFWNETSWNFIAGFDQNKMEFRNFFSKQFAVSKDFMDEQETEEKEENEMLSYKKAQSESSMSDIEVAVT